MNNYKNFDGVLDNFLYYKIILNKYKKNFSTLIKFNLLNIINMTLYLIVIGELWVIILTVLFIIKLTLLFFKQNNVFYITGLIINLCAVILFYFFEGAAIDSFLYLTLSCITYLKALKGNIVKNKLSTFYGYPSFNEIIIQNELKNNENVYKTIISDTELTNSDYILKHELKNIKYDTITKANKFFKFICLSIIVLGGSLISYSNIQKSHLNNAVDFNSNYIIEDNLYVEGNIEQILLQASLGDKNCYWIDYKGNYLYIVVPKEINSLYNNLCDNSVDVKNNIEFIGKFEKSNKKHNINKLPLERILSIEQTSPLIIDDYVLEIIDSKKNNYNTYFIFMILLGILGLLSKNVTNLIKNKIS